MRGITRIGDVVIGTVTDGYGFLVPVELYHFARNGGNGLFALMGSIESADYVEVDYIPESFENDYPEKHGLYPISIRNDFDYGGFYALDERGSLVRAIYMGDDLETLSVDSVSAGYDHPLCPVKMELGFVYVGSDGRVLPVSCIGEKDILRFLKNRRFSRYYLKRYGISVERGAADAVTITWSDEKGNRIMSSTLVVTPFGARGYLAMPDGLRECDGSLDDCLSSRPVVEWEIDEDQYWVSVDNKRRKVYFSIGDWNTEENNFTGSVKIVNRKLGVSIDVSDMSFEELVNVLGDVLELGFVIL